MDPKNQKEALPPSYNEAFASSPSAPIMGNQKPGNLPPTNPNIGWQPNTGQTGMPTTFAQPSAYPQQPIIQQPTIVVVNQANQVGEYPFTFYCLHCKEQLTTRVEKNPSVFTHIFALALCIMCLCPCAFIPYCTDAIHETTHYCPKCNSFQGRYDPCQTRRRY